VANGDVDVAIVWGPFAGYFAKNQPVALHIVPVPFEFSIAAAVRPGDERLKADIDRVLSEHREEIGRILRQYGVPLCGNTTAPFSASR
jgi:ABC-type amino acid transport substrate-binding protein